MARNRLDIVEQRETAAAAREAAAIGGLAGDEHLRPEDRPLVEGGEGVAEGFELAEEALIDATQHSGLRVNPLGDAFPAEVRGPEIATYGEGDHEESSETREGDR